MHAEWARNADEKFGNCRPKHMSGSQRAHRMMYAQAREPQNAAVSDRRTRCRAVYEVGSLKRPVDRLDLEQKWSARDCSRSDAARERKGGSSF